jgi:hypothetical protein
MMAAPIMALITRFNTDVRLPADVPTDALPGGAADPPEPPGSEWDVAVPTTDGG